eukprot:XP_001703906.1 Hypothetical protein GL50803_119457 [Giardia lamblia ATCC 50803]
MDPSDHCNLLSGSRKGLSLSAIPPRQPEVADIIQRDESTTEAERRVPMHRGPQRPDSYREGVDAGSPGM